jgi:hypothetical protein
MRTYIGVDPAIRLNGMAACFIKPNKEVEFKKYKRFVDFLEDSFYWNKAYENTVVLVEDSSLQNVTFNSSINRAILSRMSRNVGMNQAASRIAYEWIKENGCEAYNISPEQKGKKWGKEIFMKVFQNEGYKFEPNFKKDKISQDEIDCFTLALQAKNYQKHEKKH